MLIGEMERERDVRNRLRNIGTKERQRVYVLMNVTLRNVCVTIVVVKKQ
jgi:hypothetical protein